MLTISIRNGIHLYIRLYILNTDERGVRVIVWISYQDKNRKCVSAAPHVQLLLTAKIWENKIKSLNFSLSILLHSHHG